MAESWNDRIVKEFRANNGKVGGMFEGAPMVLVTTAGRRSWLCSREVPSVVHGFGRHPDPRSGDVHEF
ncbi:nitroreductase family deazaflavin-dependent oxidoreductase [Streptomyces cocklensis]|uniref:Nitroreductase family deazaflavin-dependent oxidoreductase n=1 Tax=Actinacidiphila cocklensis TaxID=887465 RepID=A0A9W4GUY3_9ACTN|nr:nitroreductase/quinone reductase family protein [Actinacidiphila cocklensis]MDD1056769.1 nitroreductase family deazaflavin-dependent oxidoreductase [Actinacidiphila cocklensis]CAG6397750.1 hypothetical protein SCOCK_60083 [Actinacidiphila cocklensis]